MREAHCTEDARIELNQMLSDVDEGCCYGDPMECRQGLHKLMMMLAKMLMKAKSDEPVKIYQDLEMLLDRYEEMAFGPMYDYHHEETLDEKPAHEAVEDPTPEQRADLPAAAFEPAAFFADSQGDFSPDGDFLVSLSKLPHHINTVENPDENEKCDLH